LANIQGYARQTRAKGVDYHIYTQDPPGASAQPCHHPGCLQYPAPHSHQFARWPKARVTSDYNPAPAPEDYPRYPYKYVRVKLGAKCEAPRVRCKIADKQRMLLRKEDGKLYCLKHAAHAYWGNDRMEALRAAEKAAPPKPKKVRLPKDEWVDV
jgi:hypothetical protein